MSMSADKWSRKVCKTMPIAPSYNTRNLVGSKAQGAMLEAILASRRRRTDTTVEMSPAALENMKLAFDARSCRVLG